VTGGRRARPSDGLPPPAPTQTCGGLLTVIECAYTYINGGGLPKYLYSSTRRLQRIPCNQHATHAVAARRLGVRVARAAAETVASLANMRCELGGGGRFD
jgi:hypothetical protein